MSTKFRSGISRFVGIKNISVVPEKAYAPDYKIKMH